MAAKLTGALREAPASVPAIATVALMCVWATSQAGYPLTHWAPGSVIVLALLLLAWGALGSPLREMPSSVRVALAAFAAYTAFSFCSIAWAGMPGDAWEGADRTLLYLIVFALFASWRARGPSAALVLGAWIAGMAGIAVFVALHVGSASAASLRAQLPEGRLVYPVGYANAAAAQWLMAAWPALLLARSAQLPWAVRGLLAGSATLLAELALVSQSRGSLYATPVMLVLVFALLPGRARTFATLVPVAAGVAAAAPFLLRVGNHLRDHAVVASNVHTAVTAMLVSAAAVAAVVALAAALERRLALDAAASARARRVVGAVALATLVAVLAGGLAAAGDPVARARHAWDTFKSPRGYAANASGSRLTSGLGSQRYDFFRVALDEFAHHPLAGIGADNFQAQYLLHGRSTETPRYPHSIELRALAQTGIVGALLLLVALVAALWAGMSAVRAAAARRLDPLAGAVAAAALAGFGYWLVHGSFDWFFEFAGLGAPAFALLGLAAALAPGRAGAMATVPAPATGAAMPASGTRAAAPRALAWACGGVAALAAAGALVAPWLSGLETDQALSVWPRSPLVAYARLQDAAALNPLSDQPYLLAGSIALRFGDLARARREFTRARVRVPGGAYATLELGAIASTLGERARAQALLARSAALQPRDAIAHEALQAVRRGEIVDINLLNRAILLKANELR